MSTWTKRTLLRDSLQSCAFCGKAPRSGETICFCRSRLTKMTQVPIYHESCAAKIDQKEGATYAHVG